MRSMLELDKLTQELKRRCATSSGHQSEASGCNAITMELQASSFPIPDRFREELINKFSAAQPCTHSTAADKQMHAKV